MAERVVVKEVQAAESQPPWPLLIRIAQGLSILLACGYLLQIATPFRLNTDSVRLHSMAIGLQEGVGLYGYGEEVFPPVFPVCLAGLEWCGMANSHVFVVVNLIALVAGWVFTWQLLAAEGRLAPQWRWLALFLTLASWVVVKHITLTLTDIPYFATSAAALLGMQRLSQRGLPHVAMRAVGVAAVIALSIGIRTHGIALLPAFLFVIGARLLDVVTPRRPSPRATVILVAGGLLATVAVIWIIATLSAAYGRHSVFASLDGLGARIGTTLAMRADNFAEIAFNVPRAKPPLLFRPLFTIAGSVCMACFVGALFHGLRRWRASDVYLAAYLALLAVWPFRDARFLLPVIPLMWSAVLCVLRPHVRTDFLATASTVAWFAITGALAIGYSTRITFSGADFPNVYSAELLNTYRAAYGQTEVPSADPVDPAIRRVIRRYQFGDREHPPALAPSTP